MHYTVEIMNSITLRCKNHLDLPRIHKSGNVPDKSSCSPSQTLESDALEMGRERVLYIK